MFCLYCGTNLPNDAVYCNKCGKRQNAATNESAKEVSILPFPPLPASSTGGGQLAAGNVAMVQGTPSMPDGSVGQDISSGVAHLPPTSSSHQSSATQAASGASPQQPQHAKQPSAPSLYSHLHHPVEHQSHPSQASSSMHHIGSAGSKVVGPVSRRTVLLGLSGATAVAIVGGGLIWLASSRHLIGSSAVPASSVTTQPILLTTVTVSATQGWQDSGVLIHAGDQVIIRYVSGLWTSQSGVFAPFDGTGQPNKYICANIEPASQCAEAVPDAIKGSIVGKIGTETFEIDDSLKFNPTQGGTLYLRMNDADSGLYDNQGSIRVQIQVF
jgi:hypothetical protein